MHGPNPSLGIIFGTALAACAVDGLPSSALAQPGSTSVIPIETMTVGAAPAGFEFARTGRGTVGLWTVVDDPTATAKRAIEQSSTDQTDYRFPLATYQPVTARNVAVTLRFKAVAGRIDRAGGIALRLTSPDDYYVVRANALEDNVRFYRVLKGRREQLAGADLKVAPEAWHTLQLTAQGDRFTVTFNGKTLYTATDNTFAEPGRIALWTKADSVTRFDQISIEILP